MEIVIEEHTQKYKEGTAIHYQVKYKLHWWSLWRYLKRHYSHADPEIEKFYLRDDAVQAAWDLRAKLEKPKITVRDLNENGEPLFKCLGG